MTVMIVAGAEYEPVATVDLPVDDAIQSPSWAAEWAAHFLTVALAFLVLWVIASACVSAIMGDHERIAFLLRSLAVQPAFVAPEPAERAAYFWSLLVVPFAILLVHPLVRARMARLTAAGTWRWFVASCIGMLLLIGWGALGDGGFYWSGSPVSASPLAFVLVTMAGVTFAQVNPVAYTSAATHRHLQLVRDYGLATAVVAAVVAATILRLVSAADPYVTDNHFEAVFCASTQVTLGATLLVEHERFERRLARCVPSALLGIGVLWNADTGVPAAGAWIMCLCHQALVRWRERGDTAVTSLRSAVATGVEAVLCAASAIACGYAALAWKGGAWPDLTMYWQHQAVLYELGYFMIPMPLMHSWVAWAAVIMAARSFGIWPLSAPCEDSRPMPLRSTLFGWAVLACGLFSYYQGRSHDWVFPVVLPFALAIVGVVVDRVALPTAVNWGVGPKWRVACVTLAAAFVVAIGSEVIGTSCDPLL